MKQTIARLALLALVIAACGGGSAATTASEAIGTTAPSVETTAPVAETTAAAETTAPVASGSSVMVSASDLGDILTDQDGRTLYLFVPDAQGEPTCYDDCAANWPAFTGEVDAGEGVDAGLLGTAERTDGALQVTYNGWPLYYFAGDAAPGETNGQGISDIWWVVDATGEAIES